MEVIIKAKYYLVPLLGKHHEEIMKCVCVYY